jgi:hypothetical protein
MQLTVSWINATREGEEKTKVEQAYTARLLDLFGSVSGVALATTFPLFDDIADEFKCIRVGEVYYPYLHMNLWGYSNQVGTLRKIDSSWVDLGTITTEFIIEETPYNLIFHSERQSGSAFVPSVSLGNASCVLHDA